MGRPGIEPHMRYVYGTDRDDRLKGTELDDVLVDGPGNDTCVWGTDDAGDGNGDGTRYQRIQ